jgi:transposase
MGRHRKPKGVPKRKPQAEPREKPLYKRIFAVIREFWRWLNGR